MKEISGKEKILEVLNRAWWGWDNNVRGDDLKEKALNDIIEIIHRAVIK